MRLTWDDCEDIAIALADKHPTVEVLSINFVELHRWVTELEEFDDDPKGSNEGKLEAIQMAWLAEVRDRS